MGPPSFVQLLLAGRERQGRRVLVHLVFAESGVACKAMLAQWSKLAKLGEAHWHAAPDGFRGLENCLLADKEQLLHKLVGLAQRYSV